MADRPTYIVVLPDGETWASLPGCAIYRLRSNAPLALADSLEDVLGDENPDAPLANVDALVADVQIQELLDEYIGEPAGPHVQAPRSDEESGFFGQEDA